MAPNDPVTAEIHCSRRCASLHFICNPRRYQHCDASLIPSRAPGRCRRSLCPRHTLTNPQAILTLIRTPYPTSWQEFRVFGSSESPCRLHHAPSLSDPPLARVRCAYTRLIHAGSASSHRPIPRIFHAQQPYTHRTPDENSKIGRTAPGAGCRRPASPAPAPRCPHHACVCATPPRAVCAAPASWIASPTHNGASYRPRPPSSLCGASPCDAPMPPRTQSPTPSLHVAAPAPMHHRDVPP